jgi:colanic acid biosynthesis protein WcaH
MPQVCVELYLEHDGGVLLARRATPPAEGEWFWPGARVYKGERLEETAHRVAEDELGIAVEVGDRLGVFEHFWRTSAAPGGPSRHTVNVVFRARPADDAVDADGTLGVTLDDQHDDWRLLRAPEADLHEYVRQYLSAAGTFEGSG